MRKHAKYTIHELCHLHDTSTVTTVVEKGLAAYVLQTCHYKDTQTDTIFFDNVARLENAANMFRTQITKGFYSRSKPTEKPQARQYSNSTLIVTLQTECAHTDCWSWMMSIQMMASLEVKYVASWKLPKSSSCTSVDRSWYCRWISWPRYWLLIWFLNLWWLKNWCCCWLGSWFCDRPLSQCSARWRHNPIWICRHFCNAQIYFC
jgi:hypothetical protein